MLVDEHLLEVLPDALVVGQSIGADGLLDLVGETLLQSSFLNKVRLFLAAPLDLHLLDDLLPVLAQLVVNDVLQVFEVDPVRLVDQDPVHLSELLH